MACNIALAKLINNGATFYYRRIVSLQLGKAVMPVLGDTAAHQSRTQREKTKWSNCAYLEY
jgi:hypothetical protein